MQIKSLDHVNVRTGRLDEMVAWYGKMLDMTLGPRPDFSFPGAWLYIGDHPAVHLVGTDPAPSEQQKDLQIEHYAFSATGLKELLGRFEEAGEPVRVAKVPGFPIVQINVWDPDGNHLHIDFSPEEAEGLGVV